MNVVGLAAKEFESGYLGGVVYVLFEFFEANRKQQRRGDTVALQHCSHTYIHIHTLFRLPYLLCVCVCNSQPYGARRNYAMC